MPPHDRLDDRLVDDPSDDEEIMPAHPDDITDYLHDLELRAGSSGRQASREAKHFFKRAREGGVRLINQRDGRHGIVNRIDVGTLSGDVMIPIDYESATEYDTAGVLAAYHVHLSGANGKFIFL